MKNGLFDIEAHRQYENTVEKMILEFKIPERIAPECQCPEKQTDKSEFTMGKVHLGMKLSNETVENLLELINWEK